MSLDRLNPVQKHTIAEYFQAHSQGGVLGLHELRSILTSARYAPTDEELQDMIKSVSVEETGINLQAFMGFVSNYSEFKNVDQEYRAAFRLYDRSGSGQLSRDNVSYVFERMQIKLDVDQLFAQVDTDKNGTIDYNEFCDMMKKSM